MTCHQVEMKRRLPIDDDDDDGILLLQNDTCLLLYIFLYYTDLMMQMENGVETLCRL